MLAKQHMLTSLEHVLAHCCCFAVALAGYVLPTVLGQPAVQCTGSTYAPYYNRLSICLPCQSGLQMPSNHTGPHELNKEVCQVPPGKFWELNVVRDCPKGLYRSGFARTDSKAAIACMSCPQGWTTAGTATPAVGLCNGEILHRVLVRLLVMQVGSGCAAYTRQQLQAGVPTK